MRVIFCQVEFIPTHRKIGHSSSISGRDPRRDHRLLLARGGRRGEDADKWGLAAREMGGRGAERRAGKAGTGRARELGRALVAGPARDSTGLAKKGKGERVTRLGWRAG